MMFGVRLERIEDRIEEAIRVTVEEQREAARQAEIDREHKRRAKREEEDRLARAAQILASQEARWARAVATSDGVEAYSPVFEGKWPRPRLNKSISSVGNEWMGSEDRFLKRLADEGPALTKEEARQRLKFVASYFDCTNILEVRFERHGVTNPQNPKHIISSWVATGVI